MLRERDSLLDILYEVGFHIIEDINIDPETLGYLTNMNNYVEVPSSEGHNTQRHLELRDSISMDNSDKTLLDKIIKSFPKNVRTSLAGFDIHFSASVCPIGYHQLPHRDFFDDTGSGANSLAHLLLWLCPTEFEGREFVYGRLKRNPTDRKVYPWEDENLEQLGSVKPRTGLGVLFDTVNPEWWHGVKELTSGGPTFKVVMIIS